MYWRKEDNLKDGDREQINRSLCTFRKKDFGKASLELQEIELLEYLIEGFND